MAEREREREVDVADGQRGRDAMITLEKWRWREGSEDVKKGKKERGISTGDE